MNNTDLSQHIANQGRNGDSMLVHMTPGEVGSLQHMAMANGGSLTMNPETGLPEAGFLSSVLPAVAGAGLTALSGGAINPLMAAAIVGGGSAVMSGDLMQGLSAGLGAYGGAGLGSALNATGTAALESAAQTQTSQIAPNIAAASRTLAGTSLPMSPVQQSVLGSSAAQQAAGAVAPSSALGAGLKAATEPGGFTNLMKVAGQKAPYGQYAGLGAMMLAPQPTVDFGGTTGTSKSSYGGPYKPADRTQLSVPVSATDTSEQAYFDRISPYPSYQPIGTSFADGGVAALPDTSNSPVSTGTLNWRAAPQTNAPAGVITSGAAPMPGAMRFGGAPIPRVAGNMPAQAPAWAGRRNLDSSTVSNPYAAAMPARGEMNYNVAAPRLSSFDLMRQQMAEADARAAAAEAKAQEAARAIYQSNNPFAPNYRAPSSNIWGYADGGEVMLEDGSFVVDARTVSELGNGSSRAGQEVLAKLGGVPVDGPGDGTSDSIAASIEGEQDARVARDEVVFSPSAVAKIGGGDKEKGAERLYKLMERAHSARKTASRGESSGLEALVRS